MTLFTAKPTHTFTLDNGLQVIVREDHRTAAFCASLFHKIGTRNERPGQRGLAYLTGSAAFKDEAAINRQIQANELAKKLKASAE